MNTPKTLTVTECHQLLDALVCKKGTEKQFRKGVRNYTMALLMLEAGLRVGEVVALEWGDIYFNCLPVTSIIIRCEISKNKEERTIPVSTRLSDALKEYDRYHRPPDSTTSLRPAFCRGKSTQKLTTRQVERIIRAAAMKSIGRPVHPHILRHTFGSRLMRKTNARIVQELLGHSSMTSTQIYTHPNSDDLKKAIAEVEKEHNAVVEILTTDARGPDAADRIDAAGAYQHHR